MGNWQGLRVTVLVTGMLCLCQSSFASGLNFKKQSASGSVVTSDVTGVFDIASDTNFRIQDEGSTLTARPTTNFTGTGVVCADDTTRTTCTINTSAASAGGNQSNIQYNAAGALAGDGAFSWDSSLNRLSISRDAGQTGEAIRISSDSGARLANISHDGSASLVNLQLDNSLPVIEGGTGLSVGTSGAVPYFNATTTMASSSLLAANAVMIGGGAGAAPSTITADTVAGHFLGSTTGSPAFRTVMTADVSGNWSVARGGTGYTTTTKGDLLGSDATGSWFRLPVGAAGQILSVDSATQSGLRYVSLESYDRGAIVDMTDAATITPNLDLGKYHRVTLGGNRVLGTPINFKSGRSYVFIISQDSTGSRTLTYSDFYRFGTDVTSPTLSTAAGRQDEIGIVVQTRGPRVSADVVAVSRGYAH